MNLPSNAIGVFFVSHSPDLSFESEKKKKRTFEHPFFIERLKYM